MAMKIASGLILGASALMLANGAAAVEADTTGAGKESQPEEGLQEIIVTANKREENLEKVGVTITALSADELAARLITNPQELASMVPGLQYATSTHNTPIYTLRGIGYNADALAVYPAVSVYLDQAPMPFPLLAGHTLYDLERVEVLKGPQGTLFGQNSTGGAINYIAAKPTDTFASGVDVTYGNYNLLQSTGFVSGPLGDGLTARLSFDALHRDDWQYSFTRTDYLGEQSYFAGRFQLDWHAIDGLKVALNINGSTDRSDPQAVQIIAVLPSEVVASPAELAVPLSPTNNNRVADWSPNPRPSGDRNLFQTSLRVDYDLNPAATITSLTTYNFMQQAPVTDLDGSAYNLVDEPRDLGHINAINEELRLSNQNQIGTPYRWTFGGNFDKTSVHEDQWISYKDNGLSDAANLFIDLSGINTYSEIKNTAVFANGEYDLLPRLTVRAGARYTKSENDTSICGYSPDGTVDTLFTILGQLFGTPPATIPLGRNDCYTLDANNHPGSVYYGTLDESNVSWKVGSDFRVTDDTLLYANISRGYKAGSFPVITASVQSVYTPARQESVTSYELGVKTKLLDGLFQTNAAVFYDSYLNKQIQGTVNSGLFGLLQDLQNVPRSRITGAEADISARPFPALTLDLGANYITTTVEEFTSTSVYGQVTNFAGNALPFAPKWTFTLNGDYVLPLHFNGDGETFLGATASYRSMEDAYIGASAIPLPSSVDGHAQTRSESDYPFVIPSYATVDVRAGYRTPGGRFNVTLWGKNIFNHYIVNNAISYNDIIVRETGMPVTYGVSFGYKLK
jgi:outer membrane receptor protein involved in Fe transport